MGKVLGDYLDLSGTASRADWRRIQARPPKEPGRRQEAFTVTETLLCLAASLLVNHRQFGGSTAGSAPYPVPQLALLFKRTNASILAKMANLDGSRSHGARFEVEAAAYLLDHGAEGLLAGYLTALDAGRSEGIDLVELPDFLGMEAGGGFEFLGQEELSVSDLEQDVEGHLVEVSERHELAEAVTERLLVAVARVNQHVFARNVLVNCGTRCVFCGMDPGPNLARKGLIRASHIKPWRDSNSIERLDVQNGLAACPTHDQAFDVGLIRVGNDLSIELANSMEERAKSHIGFSRSFGRPPLNESLALPPSALAPGSDYLDWHRTHVAA